MVMARMQESVVTPIYKQVSGEFPSPTFGQLRDIYISDPDMYTAVNFVSNRALSRGYHIECNPNVPGHEDAEEYLTDWLDNVRWGDRRNERGYTPLLRIISRELGWGGASLIELLEPDQITEFAQVQLSSLWKFQRNDVGELTAIWQYPQINPRALTPSRYLLFGWNLVDRNPFAFGLTHPVALSKPNMITGGTIPPLISIKWQIEDDIRRRLHRLGGPHSIFGVKGVNEDDAKAIAEYLQNPTADQSMITDIDVTVASDVPSARMNFVGELDYMDGRIKAATGNVLSEMLTGKGFSYASAVKAGSLADELVWDQQQVISTDTNYGILYPVLEQSGEFDPVLMKPRFVFNTPDPPVDMSIESLQGLYTSGGISQADLVRNLKKWARLDLDDPLQQGPFATSPGVPNAPQSPQSVANPGQLLTPSQGQISVNPLGIDDSAYQNMLQVQQQYERISTDLKRKLEAMAAGQAGTASAIQQPKKLKRRSKA